MKKTLTDNNYQIPTKRTEKTIINEPTEEDYDNFLNATHAPISLPGGIQYEPAYVFKETDPIMYDCGFSAYLSDHTIYECPICSNEYDTEEEANNCCKWECPICTTSYPDIEEAFECCQEIDINLDDDTYIKLQEEIKTTLTQLQ